MKVNAQKLKSIMRGQDFADSYQQNSRQAVDDAIRDAQDPPWQTDKWIYRMVVGVLGMALLLMVVFLCIRLVDPETSKIEIPDVFISIISTIAGAIAGLLAPSPTKDTPAE